MGRAALGTERAALAVGIGGAVALLALFVRPCPIAEEGLVTRRAWALPVPVADLASAAAALGQLRSSAVGAIRIRIASRALLCGRGIRGYAGAGRRWA